MTRRWIPALLVWGALSAACGFQAQDAPPPPAPPADGAVTFDLFASGSYSYNFNHPDSGKNQYRVFDYDDRRLKLDAVTFTLQKPADEPGRWGFRVDAAAGSSIPGLTAASGFYRSVSAGVSGDYDIQQVYGSFNAPLGRGLRFDLGKFFAPIGYESVDRCDAINDNASRSFLFGYALPFTTTGLRITYPFSDTVSGAVLVVQGWDVVHDNNDGKSVGACLSWTPAPPISIYLNYIGGPEQRDHSSRWRQVGDLCATWKPTGRLTLGLNYDYGHESSVYGPGQDAIWSGGALYATYGFSERFSLALRLERFDDRDGARTGVAQTLKEVTLTPTLRVGEHWVFRGDLRRDLSDRAIFERRDTFTRHQPTASFNVIFLY